MTPRRLGFRGRVAILVALPLAVVLLAGVPLLAARVDDVRAADERAAAVRSAARTAQLLAALATERDIGVVSTFVADGTVGLLVARNRSQAATDSAGAGAVTASLQEVRDAVEQGGAAPGAVVEAFRTATEAVLDGLAPAPQAVDAAPGLLLRWAERRSAAEAAAVWVSVDPSATDRAAAAAAAATAGAALFLAQARAVDPAAAQVVDTALAAAAGADTRIALLAADPGAAVAADPVAVLSDVAAAAATRADAVGTVLGAATIAADRAAAVARLVSVLVGVVLLAAAVVVLAVGLRIGGAVLRPLRRLTVAADEVADLARTALHSSADAAAPAPVLAAVNIDATDELGELVTSFNRVQAAAALLLQRQVQIRRNSAQMLGHVGRRTRSLVSRQLDLIDSLERGEQDPERLAPLYRLDHLTGRLRRSADSLLVLADSRDDELGGMPRTVLELVRAAMASIEGYERVEITEIVDEQVVPYATDDVALLVAELMENAAAFSPQHHPVVVAMSAGPASCRLEIVDRGVGMSEEERDRNNARLVEPERLDSAPSPVLGLVVVARIARRHGIGVLLRPTVGGGTTAVVDLPSRLLLRTASGSAAPPIVDSVATPALGLAVVPAVAVAPGRPMVGQAAVAGRHRALASSRPDTDQAPGAGPAEDGNGRVPAALGARPTGSVAPPGATVPAPPDGGAAVPPPGAEGFRRRVPSRSDISGGGSPRLDTLTDAEAERAFVDQLEAGVARALAEVRAAADRSRTQEVE